ncbi:MAG: cytochrome-c peroxidase [Bacteroidia bacterium]
MNHHKLTICLFACIFLGLGSCGTDEETVIEEPKSVLPDYFGDNVDYADLENYENQPIPDYIRKDNTNGNDITNSGATLGRVLFYDKNLSIDNSISCASCHKQALAFGDDQVISKGVNGFTARHSMRLVNSRFSNEFSFFWDERAPSLEEQASEPIKDHIEMGYSGLDGNPDFNDLIIKLSNIDYYNELFVKTFGDSVITEERIKNTLAQFIRSITSFDSKYDEGMAMVESHRDDFPNFSDQENEGKRLYSEPIIFGIDGVRSGGFFCIGCHRAPEFDIDPFTQNNGVIGSAVGQDLELNITRSPSLRDVVNQNGEVNGPLMHTGGFFTLGGVIDHYETVPLANNPNLDRRLSNNGEPRDLAITNSEKEALIAFLNTLTGNNIYTDKKWSDPFIR